MTLSYKVAFICGSNCCSVGNCMAGVHKDRIEELYPNITFNIYSKGDSGMGDAYIERYGLNMFPTTLYLKNDVVSQVMYGKFQNGEIEKTIIELRW